MIRSKKRQRLCICLLALNLVFIWGNSLLPGSVSETISRWVGSLIQTLTDLPVNTSQNGHGLLRKLAHFSEFACLGVLLAWLAGMAGERGFHGWSLPLLGGMMAACVDETIQTMIPARGPSVLDVWIDTCGVAVGIGLLLLGHHLAMKRTKKNHHLEEAQ